MVVTVEGWSVGGDVASTRGLLPLLVCAQYLVIWCSHPQECPSAVLIHVSASVDVVAVVEGLRSTAPEQSPMASHTQFASTAMLAHRLGDSGTQHYVQHTTAAIAPFVAARANTAGSNWTICVAESMAGGAV